jgi:hypothetical protein
MGLYGENQQFEIGELLITTEILVETFGKEQ